MNFWLNKRGQNLWSLIRFYHFSQNDMATLHTRCNQKKISSAVRFFQSSFSRFFLVSLIVFIIYGHASTASKSVNWFLVNPFKYCVAFHVLKSAQRDLITNTMGENKVSPIKNFFAGGVGTAWIFLTYWRQSLLRWTIELVKLLKNY